MERVILSFATFLLSFIIVGKIKELLGKYLLDIPNERSSHTIPIPRGGGLGFITAFGISSIIASASSFYSTSPRDEPNINLICLWIALLPLAVVGFLDDQYSLPNWVRYLVHLITAGLAIKFFGSFPIPWIADIAGTNQLLSAIITVIGITALINFYNFMDGLDGLVAGVTGIQLGFLAIYLNQPFLWLLVAALVGFLWWNWSPAKIFMGDVGSTVLGAVVAITLLNSSNEKILTWSALVITLPLTGDAIYTLVFRLIRRENIFKAHRLHLYQRLSQSGLSHSQVAATYVGSTGLIALTVSCFREVGAWICLTGAIVAIISGETYLKTHTYGDRQSS